MIAAIRRAGARVGALALLPLSAIPLLLVGPGLVASHARFDRRFHSPPYPAAPVAFSAAALARYTPVAEYRGAVPVLGYHGINERNDGYSVSREEFARQMAMLDRSGFRAISIAQYLRFRAGITTGLPARPVLITFDDGRLDSYRGADRVLARYHQRAVMYVITEPVRAGNAFHLSWHELHRMQASGRWDVQPHAHDGHHLVVRDGAGRTGPFYTNLRFTRSDGMESFGDYTRRVAGDIYALKDDFRAQGLDSQTFAAPFGDRGQQAPARMRRFLDDLLASQFAVVFVQRPGNDPPYTTPAGPAERYELHTATTTDELHEWLVRHDPAEGRS
jgi:peptidoglycan/xylan/chitin deacetylase (PgdA/CDA1 family)